MIEGEARVAVPSFSDARLYYRCALQRLEEAEVLRESGYTTGAVYLGGYGVECILKALILESVPFGDRANVLRSFRGNRAHEFGWLKDHYLEHGGARLPRDIVAAFTLVDHWSTDLRYYPRFFEPRDAKSFLRAASAIVEWANGRL